ncbi:MAG: zf-TFIIB domain-containing protein [Candidatus Sumerlaeaceae bacterium]|nr:zf-TFIIB domain-containing protein [Candidatus Sumerlaeaceae bacterium]
MIPVCPRCDVALTILVYEEMRVDYCAKCRGIWLDSGELEDLLARTGAAANAEHLAFQRREGIIPPGRKNLCPRCDERLQEVPAHPYQGADLIIDRCPAGHGIWFDCGELKKLLLGFPESDHTNKTVAFLSDMLGNIFSDEPAADSPGTKVSP